MCLLINQSSLKSYIIPCCTLILEIIIMSSAAWMFWMLDLPFQAGKTIISEYSIVLFLRLIMILTFQRELLYSVVHMFVGFANRILLIIRMSANFSQYEIQEENGM